MKGTHNPVRGFGHYVEYCTKNTENLFSICSLKKHFSDLSFCANSFNLRVDNYSNTLRIS